MLNGTANYLQSANLPTRKQSIACGPPGPGAAGPRMNEKFLLQLLEGYPAGVLILEQADLPEFLAHQFLMQAWRLQGAGCEPGHNVARDLLISPLHRDVFAVLSR